MELSGYLLFPFVSSGPTLVVTLSLAACPTPWVLHEDREQHTQDALWKWGMGGRREDDVVTRPVGASL